MRSELAYFACGCAFVVIGQALTGWVTQRAMAQTGATPSATYDSLTVRRLAVVDASGRTRALLEAEEADPTGTILQVFTPEGASPTRGGARLAASSLRA